MRFFCADYSHYASLINWIDLQDGESVLKAAARGGHLEVVKALVKLGADANVMDNVSYEI